MIKIGLILVIIFLGGFALSKWLSDRFEDKKLELEPPFKKSNENNTDKE